MSRALPLNLLSHSQRLAPSLLCQTCRLPLSPSPLLSSRSLHTSPPTLVKRRQEPFKFKPPEIDQLGRPVLSRSASGSDRKHGSGKGTGQRNPMVPGKAARGHFEVVRTTDKMRRTADAAEGRVGDAGAGAGSGRYEGDGYGYRGQEATGNRWERRGRQGGRGAQGGGRSGFGLSRSGEGSRGDVRSAGRDGAAFTGSGFGKFRSARSSDEEDDRDRSSRWTDSRPSRPISSSGMSKDGDGGRSHGRSSFGMSQGGTAADLGRYNRGDRNAGGSGSESDSGWERSIDSRSDRSRSDDFARPYHARPASGQAERPLRHLNPDRNSTTRRFHAHAPESSSSTTAHSSSSFPSSSSSSTPSPSTPSPARSTFTHDAPSKPPHLPLSPTWNPTKKLTYPAMNGLRHLHFSDPATYTKSNLAEKFGISYEAVSRILKSRFDAAGVKADQVVRAASASAGTAGTAGSSVSAGKRRDRGEMGYVDEAGTKQGPGPRDWDGLTIKQQVQAYDPVPHIDRQLARRQEWAEAERRRIAAASEQ